MVERDGKVVGRLMTNEIYRAPFKIYTELLHINAQFDLMVNQIKTLNDIVANQRETINQLNGFEEADEQ